VILDLVSNEHLDTAVRGIEAYNRGDLDGMLELVAEDVKFVVPDSMANSGTYRGYDGYREMLEHWDDAWDEFQVEVGEPFEHDDAVIVPVVQHGRGRGSGIVIRMNAAYLMRFRDGLLYHWQVCESREEALRVAGSS
jgi:ketosteroid isomerase-like protein